MGTATGSRRETQGLRSRLARSQHRTTSAVLTVSVLAAAWIGRSVSDGPTLTLLLASLLLCGPLAHRLATKRSIHRAFEPLQRLFDAMRRLADREFGVRLDESGPSDVSVLARRFNVTAARLEESHIDDVASSRVLTSDFEHQSAALRRAREQLGALDNAKEAFLSNISHEMRTPLTSVIAATEILENFTDDDQSARAEFLQIIERESRRLLQLVDSVLEFAKAQSNEIELRVENHSLSDIVHTVVGRVAKARPETHAAQRIRVDDSAASATPIRCDRPRLESVFEHLFDNALKFSPVCGAVEVRIAPTDRAEGFVVYVEDEGVGVPLEHRANLFRGFGQRRSVLTDKTKGVGVGLALSAAIIHAHGGTIRFEERPVRGSCFAVELPRSPPTVRNGAENGKTSCNLEFALATTATDFANQR